MAPFDAQRLLDSRVKQEIATLYATIYSAPPWNEPWTVENALEEIDEVRAKTGFAGALARECGTLIGFSWGYLLPATNTSRVDFETIRRELSKNNVDPDRTFYGADTGVSVDYRQKRIGEMLVRVRTPATIEALCLRTKNPAMVRIYERVFGPVRFSFPEESAYAGGRVYVFELKNTAD